jgi:hypothetical protein
MGSLSSLTVRLDEERDDLTAKAETAGGYLPLMRQREYEFRVRMRGLSPTIMICGVQMFNHLQMEIVKGSDWADFARWRISPAEMDQLPGYPFARKMSVSNRSIMRYKDLWIVAGVCSENAIVFL